MKQSPTAMDCPRDLAAHLGACERQSRPGERPGQERDRAILARQWLISFDQKKGADEFARLATHRPHAVHPSDVDSRLSSWNSSPQDRLRRTIRPTPAEPSNNRA